MMGFEAGMWTMPVGVEVRLPADEDIWCWLITKSLSHR